MRLLGLDELQRRRLVDGLNRHDAVGEQPAEEHAHDAAVRVDHGRRKAVGLQPLAESAHLGVYLERRAEVVRAESFPAETDAEAQPMPLPEARVSRVVVVRDAGAHEVVDGSGRIGLAGVQHVGIGLQELAQLARVGADGLRVEPHVLEPALVRGQLPCDRVVHSISLLSVATVGEIVCAHYVLEVGRLPLVKWRSHAARHIAFAST